jgi:rhodanese-related sulfurtransferase
MSNKKFTDLINDCLADVKEYFPWDIEEKIENSDDFLILDVREPYEYEVARIENSINVPRGILESACDWGYDETVPELAAARDKEIVVVCRSGNRSVLAAFTMQLMGYSNVSSMKTGLRGWNDNEQALIDNNDKPVDVDEAESFFESKVSPEQTGPV